MKTNHIFIREFEQSQRIIHMLMIKSHFMPEMGLFYGKMGVCISLFHYGRYSGVEAYENIAFRLLEDICENVHCNSTFDFESGLCGIGWGIEYLIKSELVGGDSLEICSEIDKLIMMRDPRRINNSSLGNGIEGLLHYVCAHLPKEIGDCTPLPFDNTYLNDLMDALSGNSLRNKSPCFDKLIQKYRQFHLKGTAVNYEFSLSALVDYVVIGAKPIPTLSLGLKSGLAGILLRNIHIV